MHRWVNVVAPEAKFNIEVNDLHFNIPVQSSPTKILEMIKLLNTIANMAKAKEVLSELSEQDLNALVGVALATEVAKTSASEWCKSRHL